MKHHAEDTGFDPTGIAQALEQVGVHANAEQCELLARHARLVLEANQTMNLTRIVSPEDVLNLHIVDSLAFLPRIKPLCGTVLEVGSGAGYPGIPLAILGMDVTLCESLQKKARFLEECVTELGLSCRVLPLRAEEVAAGGSAEASVVVARAVSSLASLIELASPLLIRGGRLVALKGRPDDSERAGAARAAPLCGMREAGHEEYSLPAGDLRSVFVYERFENSRIQLPRRPGMAQRQPLGE